MGRTRAGGPLWACSTGYRDVDHGAAKKLVIHPNGRIPR